MATVVDICNLALAALGDSATVSSIDPPEGSAQADHCARFYPIVRDEVLEAANWSFASRTVDITKTTPVEGGWTYAYFLPTDCLRVQRLVRKSAVAGELFGNIEFILGVDGNDRQILMTNDDDIMLRYTKRITDPTKYTASFTNALVARLAADLAGPVLKGRTGAQAKQSQLQLYTALIGKEITKDANQNNNHREYVPQAMVARGATPLPRYRQMGN